jgi:hypothetical protein
MQPEIMDFGAGERELDSACFVIGHWEEQKRQAVHLLSAELQN